MFMGTSYINVASQKNFCMNIPRAALTASTILRWAWFLALTLLFTACGSLSEEIQLNRSGSGVYRVVIDMSDLMQMEDMLDQMDTDNSSDLPKNLGAYDSTFRLADAPDSVKAQFKGSPLVERIVVHARGDEAANTFQIVLELNFDSIEDINEFYDLSSENNPGSGMASMLINPSTRFALKGKTLSRTTHGEEPLSEEEKQEQEFMLMMLSSSNYKCTYILPGKVKRTTMPGATIQKPSTVIVERTLGDYLTSGSGQDGEITFK